MSQHRWVVVADSPFLPAQGGGEREHLGFVRAARRAGVLAALVVPTSEDVDPDPYAAEVGDAPVIFTRRRESPLMLAHPRYPYVVASRPARAGLADEVRAAAGPVTGVVTFSYKARLIGQALSAELDVPMILRQHNREGNYHRGLAQGLTGPRRLVMTWEAARITRDERRVDRDRSILAIADISRADAAARRAAGAHNVLYVPPFAFDAGLAGRASGGESTEADGQAQVAPSGSQGAGSVLFLGALDVPTNTSALQWFLTSVWPLILAESPGTVLEVVGRAPGPELRAALAGTPQVTLHADVPSLAPFFQRATVAVNPAVTGSGVNIKVIDYLQAGVPVVSTSLATQGLDLRAGIDLEVADDPAGFGAAVLALLADPRRRERLARSGREQIGLLLDPARNIQRLADAFEGHR